MPNVDGGSLWQLVERRAAATPDALAAVDEDGRTLTWAEAKADGRAGRRRASPRLGIGAGDVVSWQLPTWLESKVLVLALARLGAIQNPMLPIYREREVGFVTRQATSKLLVVPSTWSGFDFEAMARGIAARWRRGRLAGGARGRQGAAAGRPGRRCPPPPDPDAGRRCAGTSTRRARPPIPKGAQHTDRTILASALGMNAAPRGHRRRQERGRVPVHPHRRHRLAVQRPRRRVPHRVHRALRPGPHHRAHPGARGHDGRRRHAVPHGVPRRPAPAARRASCSSRRCGCTAAAARRSPRSCTTTSRPRWAATSASCRATASPRRRSSPWARVHDTDEQLANTEGKATGGVQLRVVTLEGKEAGHRRGGRDPGQGPAADEGLPRHARSTPTPSTRTAGSGPATSAASTPTAWSRSPAG